jgi:hypothetical protein
MSAEITDKAHILIGVRENGAMTVIAGRTSPGNLRCRIE